MNCECRVEGVTQWKEQVVKMYNTAFAFWCVCWRHVLTCKRVTAHPATYSSLECKHNLGMVRRWVGFEPDESSAAPFKADKACCRGNPIFTSEK